MTKVIFTEAFNEALSSIEDYIFKSTGKIEMVERVLNELDRVVGFIINNPVTPAPHPVTGDQSWVMGEGRYRLFFRAVSKEGEETTIFLLHIIDNRQLNRDVYPGNTLPTYEEE